MDGSNLEHSDSDSGESWTLLDNTSSYADDAPDVENLPQSGNTALNIEKDDDTDGISIISDSDPESPSPCDKCILDEDPPTGHNTPEFVSKTHSPNSNNNYESIRCEEEFVGDNKCKLRTYVHRRNQRLSTVLNIIVLGSVITAAGVAIGHMWGAKHDCSFNTAPSVNKILSNLYKLQEENAYLRSKLKELTILNNRQLQHKQFDSEKGIKHQRCKKVFEESLNNRNSGILTKCVENEIVTDKVLESHLVAPKYEKELLNDIDKLKDVYLQNKSWLDTEIARKVKHENESAKRFKKQFKSSLPSNTQTEQDGVYKSVESNNTIEIPYSAEAENDVKTNNVPAKIVSYADSLKSVTKSKKIDRSTIDVDSTNYIRHSRKKRHAKERDIVLVNSASEEDIKKDDRYTSHRFKIERKKNDRQKSNKKQKRKNKYEQWEMKGGYLKDYDDFTLTSSQDNIQMNVQVRRPSTEMSEDNERNNYLNKVMETENENKTKKVDDGGELKFKLSNRTSKRDKSGGNKKDFNWYEKRVTLRMEARKKLEKELFEESIPNTAGWYFRRMQRREQCRVKGENSTYRKFSKRLMNYKTKT